MFEGLKKAQKRIGGWQEERAEKRYRHREKQIKRLRREAEYHKAKRAYQKAKGPSAFEGFLGGISSSQEPSLGLDFGFGSPRRRRHKTRRHRRR